MAVKKDKDKGSLFEDLVNSLGLQAMVALGKFAPGGQPQEVHLDQARQLIDVLGMLQEKTQGNLTERERGVLEMTLTNLRLTYVDEVKRKPAEAAAGKGGAEQESGEEGGKEAGGQS
jgi:hypothetical protein